MYKQHKYPDNTLDVKFPNPSYEIPALSTPPTFRIKDKLDNLGSAEPGAYGWEAHGSSRIYICSSKMQRNPRFVLICISERHC